MTRIGVTLPDELLDALGREARRRCISVSAVAREAIAEHLGLGGEQRRDLPFAGIGRSGTRHTAREAEGIFAREWPRARDR